MLGHALEMTNSRCHEIHHQREGRSEDSNPKGIGIYRPTAGVIRVTMRWRHGSIGEGCYSIGILKSFAVRLSVDVDASKTAARCWLIVSRGT